MAIINDFVPADVVDGLQQIDVTATSNRITNIADQYYNTANFTNQNLLRSCKFSMMMLRHPKVMFDSSISDLREFTFLCDSLEIPGRTAVTTEFVIPGLQKIKTPYRREFNELNVTFYHNTKFPIFQYFTDWMDSCSTNSTQNQYFDDIVTDINIHQLNDVSSTTDHRRYMTVSLFNVYPTSVASLPCNWADDGFHKLNVTLYYEFTGSSSKKNVTGKLSDILDFSDSDLRDRMKEYGEKATSDILKDYKPVIFDIDLGG